VTLYLVHHGDAVGPEVDPMRPLSDQGRSQVEALAKRSSEQGAKPDVVWHSGKLRARQTAEAFWRYCNPLAAFAATRGLQPSDPPTWIIDVIAGDRRAVMLVGHFPHLPRLFGVLLGDDPEAAPAPFPLHGIVALEHEEDRWKEKWRLQT
jgi:phosphohistidine phosphatase